MGQTPKKTSWSYMKVFFVAVSTPQTAWKNNQPLARYGPLKLGCFSLLLGNLGSKLSHFYAFFGHTDTNTMSMVLKFVSIVETIKWTTQNQKNLENRQKKTNFWLFFAKNGHFSQKCIFLKSSFFATPPQKI